MKNLDEFNRLVGDTIMLLQCIEHDIKIIYAAMLKGDFYSNLALVQRETLGTVLVALYKLDTGDGNPELSEEDYRLLKGIKNTRNYIAHEAYTDFLYSDGEEFNKRLLKNLEKLKIYNDRVQILSKQVEKVRFSVLFKYRGM